jgi:hypothetical protein
MNQHEDFCKAADERAMKAEDENAKLRAEITGMKADQQAAYKANIEDAMEMERLKLQLGEQAKAIRNVQRALKRNENREINMGQAWELIKEAVAEKRKCDFKVDAVKFGRERCEHVLPCPMHG